MTKAYPLQWPAGWPRTQNPQRGVYKTSLSGAINNLKAEITRLCGAEAAKTLILSSNATLGDDNPKDCGVVAYVTWEKEQIAIPCDRWGRTEHNVQAIALTIEAMRAMERHGAKHMIKAMFRGFTALPAPGEAPRAWWLVLGFDADSISIAQIEEAYKNLAKKRHPDVPGGSHEKFVELQRAVEEGRRELGFA